MGYPARVVAREPEFPRVVPDPEKEAIFDEIVTGFRLVLGGASSWFGVAPDLGAIGKIIGGGFPIGGFGGRRGLPLHVRPASVTKCTRRGDPA